MTSQDYNAKVTAELKARFPKAKEIIVADAAPTRCGYKIVSRRPPPVTNNVIYYRKSSGGRWGRSVQLMEVVSK